MEQTGVGMRAYEKAIFGLILAILLGSSCTGGRALEEGALVAASTGGNDILDGNQEYRALDANAPQDLRRIADQLSCPTLEETELPKDCALYLPMHFAEMPGFSSRSRGCELDRSQLGTGADGNAMFGVFPPSWSSGCAKHWRLVCDSDRARQYEIYFHLPGSCDFLWRERTLKLDLSLLRETQGRQGYAESPADR